MRKLHEEFCKLERPLARTSLSSQLKMVWSISADSCLKGHNSLFSETFHPFSPPYRTNAADSHGSQWSQHSRATEWKTPCITLTSQSHQLGIPCPRNILKMGQRKHCSWSLEQMRRLFSHPKSSVTICQDRLLIQTLPGGQAMWQLLCLSCWGQKPLTMYLRCCATAPATRSTSVSFTCTGTHRAARATPAPHDFHWKYLLLLHPSNKAEKADQSLAAFNLPDEIRRLRAFRLLCSAAINLKRSRGRWNLQPNGQLGHGREKEPFHGPYGYHLPPQRVRFDYPLLNIKLQTDIKLSRPFLKSFYNNLLQWPPEAKMAVCNKEQVYSMLTYLCLIINI